jgi:MFS family permease
MHRTASEEHASRVPPLVKQLGWVSFFTDTATELLYPLIPIFLTVTLGAPAAALGLVEGLADGLATGLKAVAGIVADRIRHHRRMVQIGYAMAAVAKPLIALAPSWGYVAALRGTDRIGKAIRGVPRDLMIAEAAPEEDRGRNFGFHRAMDTAGAVCGPLAAILLLLLLGQRNLRWIFLVTLVPGLASVWLLRKLPKTSDRPTGKGWGATPLPWRGRFGFFAVVTLTFSVGNSSDAFLLLHANRDLGLTAIEVVLAYALYNLVYALLSVPAGVQSDRIGRARVYAAGLVAFAVVYSGFAFSHTGAAVWPLLALYGAYMAFTDGIAKALVIDVVPAAVRGKALGVIQAITGFGVLLASIGAGVLYQEVSHSAPFVLGASAALVSAILLIIGTTRGVFSKELVAP